MQIVDRRLNPGGRSLGNRQRFVERARAAIREAVRESAGERRLRDAERGGEVAIPASGIAEPQFHRGQGGRQERVLPGNRDYLEGDRIPRPPGGAGGRGSRGSPEGGGEDSFRFALTDAEFLDLLLEDLELPDLAKKRATEEVAQGVRRAGFATQGSPSNLSLTRTLRNAMSRRLALHRPRAADLAEAEQALDGAAEPEEAARLGERLAALRARSLRIPWIDPMDVRYRQSHPAPRPIAQAVMFCVMDVSGSMTESMKDLAKRFFLLLHLFLRRRYGHVAIVFIRHTHEAAEVDEETFFRSPETGGTVVSTAIAEVARVIRARYSPADWNIYVAQASDGDNTASDNPRTARLLAEAVLPHCQHYAYLEVAADGDGGPMGFVPRESEVWRTYTGLRAGGWPLAMRRVRRRGDIYPVFRDLFRRGASAATHA